MRWRFSTLLLGALVTGCSGFTPFPVSPPALSYGVKDPGTRVAICYNGLKTPDAEVRRLGQEQCPANTAAELLGTDYRFDSCPLMTPTRATFLCKTAK